MSSSTASVLRVENVSKKFRKGEIFDSLRDLIPAMTGKLFKPGKSGSSPTGTSGPYVTSPSRFSMERRSALLGRTEPARARF